MRRECRERFPPSPILKEIASYRSRHASRHVRHARAVMHVGIAYPRLRGKCSRHSRRMRISNFTYLVRGPLSGISFGFIGVTSFNAIIYFRYPNLPRTFFRGGWLAHHPNNIKKNTCCSGKTHMFRWGDSLAQVAWYGGVISRPDWILYMTTKRKRI